MFKRKSEAEKIKNTATSMSVNQLAEKKQKRRRYIALFLALAVIVVVVGGLWLWSLWQHYNEVKYQNALHHAQASIQERINSEHIRWLNVTADTGYSLDAERQKMITEDYISAWLMLREHFKYGRTDHLYARYVGIPFLMMKRLIEDSVGQGMQIDFYDTAHQLDLRYLNNGKDFCAFSDRLSFIWQLRNKEGQVITQDDGVLTLNIMMSLDYNGWNIRNMQWVDYDSLTNQRPQRQTPPGFLGIQDGHLSIDGQRVYLKGVNYYPRGNVWQDFWLKYNAEQTRKDLRLVKDLGMNVVRIFIQYGYFGQNMAEEVAYIKPRLKSFLRIAEEEDIGVIVTLFDRIHPPTFYEYANYNQHAEYLQALVPDFVNNKAIWAWDMKNEGDTDYNYEGDILESNRKVDLWARYIIRVMRRLDQSHLITLGWLYPSHLLEVGAACDFLSFHFFAPLKDLEPSYTFLKHAFPGKPIVLGEFGYHTLADLRRDPHLENEQLQYFEAIIAESRAQDIDGYLVWTLFDHPEDTIPWPVENNMGIIRWDGSRKPAVAAFVDDMILSPNPFYSRWGWLKRQGPLQVSFHNSQPRTLYKFKVYNVNGDLVFHKQFSNLAVGNHVTYWHGKDDQNQYLPSGKYYVVLELDNEKYQQALKIERRIPWTIKDSIWLIPIIILALILAFILDSGSKVYRKYKPKQKNAPPPAITKKSGPVAKKTVKNDAKKTVIKKIDNDKLNKEKKINKDKKTKVVKTKVVKKKITKKKDKESE